MSVRYDSFKGAVQCVVQCVAPSDIRYLLSAAASLIQQRRKVSCLGDVRHNSSRDAVGAVSRLLGPPHYFDTSQANRQVIHSPVSSSGQQRLVHLHCALNR